MAQLVFLDKLTKKFASTVIFNELSFSISKGEVVSLVGPSGCGKSTLLKIIMGGDTDYVGTIKISDASPLLYSNEHSIGFLPQTGFLVPWRSAIDNILLPIDLKRQRTASDIALAKQLLCEFGLKYFEHSRPRNLSGGMRQRIALAQLLIKEHELMLFDEPLSSLDEPLRWRLIDRLRKHLRPDITAVWVTHSVDEAVAISDRIAVWYRPNPNHGYAIEFCEGLRKTAFSCSENGMPNLDAIKEVSKAVLATQAKLNNHSEVVI